MVAIVHSDTVKPLKKITDDFSDDNTITTSNVIIIIETDNMIIKMRID